VAIFDRLDWCVGAGGGLRARGAGEREGKGGKGREGKGREGRGKERVSFRLRRTERDGYGVHIAVRRK